MADPRNAGWARRGAAAAGGAIAVLAAVLVLLLVLLDTGAVASRVASLVQPRLSAALGRDVRIGRASFHLLPSARVALRDLSIAGRTGEPDLLRADALDVDVALWPLVASRGKDVEVRAFRLVRPVVSLVRARDGTWSYEGLGARGGTPPRNDGGRTRVAVEDVRGEKGTIRIVDRMQGNDDAAVAMSDLDVEARGVGSGLPLDARVAAALASDRQNVFGTLSVARLPDGVPARPRDWPAVQGRLQIGALPLDRLRALLPAELGAIVRGGTASFEATVSSEEPTSYRVDGEGALKDVRLRGQAASGRFHAVASWSPARADRARVDLTEIALDGPGVDLSGHASLETAPVRGWFVVTGPLLDLDAVMGVLPDRAPRQDVKGDLVPASLRRRIQAATVRGTLALGELHAGRVRATDVRSTVSLSGGVLTLEQLDAAVFGGRVSGGGTRIDLGEKEPTWKLAARLAGVDVGAAMQAFSGAAPLAGKVNGSLDVDGRGTVWEKLREGLTGRAALALTGGALTTADVGEQVLGALGSALHQAGRAGAAERVAGARGRTELRDVSGQFAVKDGFLAAQAPMEVGTPFGRLALGGRIGLDGRLDLDGTAAVPRSALGGAAASLALPATVDVPLAIGGKLQSPEVKVRAEDAAARLVRGVLRQAQDERVRQAEGERERLRRQAERQGRSAAGEVLKRLRR